MSITKHVAIDGRNGLIYVRVSEGPIENTKEILDIERILVDYDKNGNIVGVEIIGLPTEGWPK